MKRDLLDRLLAARAERRPACLVTELSTGLQTLYVVGPDGKGAAHGGFGLDGEAMAAVTEALAADRSGTVETARGRLFLNIHNPPARLIVVGAVHIAQPLVPMAALSGYDVTVVDPRRAFLTDARFPGIHVSDEWPDDALTALAPDARTAVVTLTHDPKLDDPALAVALRSPCFYIGALGSRKTHAKRVARLTELGFDEAAIGRIHGPVGLSIGAVTPAEIAVSIMADITRARRARAEG